MSESPSTYNSPPVADDQRLRERAEKRLRARRDLLAHALAYVLVNVFLSALWLLSDWGFFWPIFPIFGWGIGLAFHAWDVYAPEASEEQIRAEMNRLRSR